MKREERFTMVPRARNGNIGMLAMGLSRMGMLSVGLLIRLQGT